MRHHPVMSFLFSMFVLTAVLPVRPNAEEGVNQSPVAIAEPDTTVECAGTFLTQFKTPVRLDGTGSFDPDGDPISYMWTAPGVVFDDPTSPTPTGRFPLGMTTVTLVVSDGAFDDEDTVDVLIVDTTPPLIAVSLNRDVLWPPTHMLADIFAVAAVTMECCGTLPTVVLDSIWSSEPDNDIGDGDTVDDIQDAQTGVRDVAFKLRSERSGRGDGRVYTMIYTATDCSGNSASDTVCVRVPHSQAGGKAVPSLGFAPDGTALDPTTGRFVIVVLSEPPKYKKDKKKNWYVASEGFDATALDPSRTYIGNIKGVLTPERTAPIDVDGDGLQDLALYYSARAANLLIEESIGDAVGDEWKTSYGAIGLQYSSPAGVDYLVPDIFVLGPPVPLEPGAAAAAEPERASRVTNDQRTALLPSYPNPFNPSTTIAFELAAAERVTIRIYNARGALVCDLEDRAYPAGAHTAVWNGRDNEGRSAATGVYFVRFRAGTFETTQKVVLIK